MTSPVDDDSSARPVDVTEDDDARSELRQAMQLARRLQSAATPLPQRKTRERGKAKIAFRDEKQELTAGAIKRRDMSQTSKLRLRLAHFAMWAVSIQLGIANIYFGYYLWQSQSLGFDTTVMVAWLSATVVEIIGIVVIVARNLFPAASVGERRSDFRRLLKMLEKKLDAK